MRRGHPPRRGRSDARAAWPYLLCVCGFVLASALGLGSAGRDRLGLPGWGATIVLLTCVLCRSMKLHVYWMRGGRDRLSRYPGTLQDALIRWRSPFAEETQVMLNVGGAVIPLCFSVYALTRIPVNQMALFAIALLVCWLTDRTFAVPLRRRVAIPFGLLGPAASLLASALLGPEQWGVLAYVGGTAGILAGADLIRLGDLRNIGKPEVVIGQAESFDAVFINQLVALLVG